MTPGHRESSLAPLATLTKPQKVVSPEWFPQHMCVDPQHLNQCPKADLAWVGWLTLAKPTKSSNQVTKEVK